MLFLRSSRTYYVSLAPSRALKRLADAVASSRLQSPWQDRAPIDGRIVRNGFRLWPRYFRFTPYQSPFSRELVGIAEVYKAGTMATIHVRTQFFGKLLGVVYLVLLIFILVSGLVRGADFGDTSTSSGLALVVAFSFGAVGALIWGLSFPEEADLMDFVEGVFTDQIYLMD